jgi:hypothetical protein
VTLLPVADDVIRTVGVWHQKLVLLPVGDVAVLFELVGLKTQFGAVPG